ncbi:radical SAM protein [Labilibacter sediminis]|nr:radical SAM protein [Labilibacter sediminis]
MATFLFEDIIFGPVKSRRLGVSLGINLLPVNKKICTFDCIYCECGFNDENKGIKTVMPKAETVLSELKKVFIDMTNKNTAPDVITYAGNGEPTIHPDFELIIDGTIQLRNQYFPKARIAVLSNGTLIHKPSVFNALNKIDDNILKLDSGLEKSIQILDQPAGNFTLDMLVDGLLKFKGNLIIQTMFVKGTYNNINVDNTTDEDISTWLELIKKIAPKMVMIYTIERDTPVDRLEKVALEDLQSIAAKVEDLGISTQVSG